MEISVERFTSNDRETLGLMWINDEFECFTIEDPPQEEKIPGKTRIPEGRYEITLRTFGGFHRRYMNRFEFHKGMLWIRNIPNFSDVLIHIGNSHKDTEGCILVGSAPVLTLIDDKKYWTVSSSSIAYSQMYQKVVAALENREIVYLTIDDRA